MAGTGTKEDGSESYKICLCLGGTPKRNIVSLSKEHTLEQVEQMARDCFAAVLPSIANVTGSQIVLQVGFPPKPVRASFSSGNTHAATDTDTGTDTGTDTVNHHHTLARSVLAKNERVQVQVVRKGKEDLATTEPVATVSSSVLWNEPISTTRGRRPQRVAAKAATESFKDVIRAQDKLLRKEKQQLRKPKSSSNLVRTTVPPNRKRARSNNDTANAKAPTKTTTTAAQRNLAKLPGRRLADGAAVNASRATATANGSSASSRLSRSKASGKNNKIRSQDDVAFALMDSISSGSSSNKIGQVLRGAMRNAVHQAYAKSRANARVAAVQGKQYTLVLLKGTTNDVNDDETSGLLSSLDVSFSKGMEGRGCFTEQVDLIPRKALVAVVSAIYQSNDDNDDNGSGGDSNPNNHSGKEMLRPNHLAQLSPRVFWSLIHHCNNPSPPPSPPPPLSSTAVLLPPFPPIIFCSSVEQSLHELLPELDWSFCHNRKKILSAKAKENIRQTRQKEQEDTNATNDSNDNVNEHNIQAAQEAVQAVEDAMEQLHQHDQSRMRERAARAALSRFGPTSSDSSSQKEQEQSWKLTTPNELDEEELQECIQQGRQGQEDATNVNLTPLEQQKQQEQEWVHKLIHKCGIHNWRQLANANATDIARHLFPPSKDKNSSDDSSYDWMSVIDSWLDYAQQESLEEIIVEVCDGRVDAVELLKADQVRSGTPKDLANWRNIPELLFKEYCVAVSSGIMSDDNDADTNTTRANEASPLSHNKVTVQVLEQWCRRAYLVLSEQEEYEWLNWYATGVGQG